MIQDKLNSIVTKLGLKYAIKTVGGVNNYIKIMYDGNLKDHYKKSKIPPYIITNDSLYIDDILIQTLGLEDRNYYKREEKILGDFRYGTKDNLCYLFKAYVIEDYRRGQKMWKVIGISGDFGFGYPFLSNRNTMGVRHRKQIFYQIIDKFNLEKYY